MYLSPEGDAAGGGTPDPSKDAGAAKGGDGKPAVGDTGQKFEVPGPDGKPVQMTLTEMMDAARETAALKQKLASTEEVTKKWEAVRSDIAEALLKNDPQAADRMMAAAGLSAEFRAQALAQMGQNAIDDDEEEDEDIEDERLKAADEAAKKAAGKGKPDGSGDPEARKVAAEAKKRADVALEELQKAQATANARVAQDALEKALDASESLRTILKKDDGKNPWPDHVRKSALSRLVSLVRSKGGFDPSTIGGLAKQAVKDTEAQMASFREGLQSDDERRQPNVGPLGLAPNTDLDFSEPYKGKVPNLVSEPENSKQYIGSLLARELAGLGDAS